MANKGRTGDRNNPNYAFHWSCKFAVTPCTNTHPPDCENASSLFSLSLSPSRFVPVENYDRRGKFSSSVFYLILSSRVHRVEKLATPSRFFPPSSLPSYRLTIFPRQVSMGRVTFRPLTEAPRGWGLMRTTDFAGKLVVFFFSRFFLSSLRSSPCACFYNTRRVFTGLFSGGNFVFPL